MQIIVNSPKGGTAVVDPFKKRIVQYKPSKAYLDAKAKLDKVAKIDAKSKLHDRRLTASFVKVCILPKLMRSIFQHVQS